MPERLSPAWREMHLKAADESLMKAQEHARHQQAMAAPSLAEIEQAKMWAAIAQAHYQAADMYPYTLDSDGRML